MARRGSRVWDTVPLRVPAVGQLAANTTASVTLFTNTENNVMPLGGGFKLNRLLGMVNLVVQDFIAGSADPSMWHGLLLCEEEVAGTGVEVIEVTDEDANLGSWLWREPIPWQRTSFSSGATVLYYSHCFDWAIRGGRGSTVRVGQKIIYVLQHVSVQVGNTALVHSTLSYLALYGA